ncbi:MAG: ABC transporter permease [Clostridia bacterium]|nr:ABC transporter permease [Clostridia bacterium]
MFKESTRMSWANIAGNKMRSFLTILGIIIGVTAIITLITVVSGATREITDQFTALGTGKITINATGTPLKRGLSENDIDDLSRVYNVEGVSPTVNMTVNARSSSAFEETVNVEGKNEVSFRRDPEIVARGRPLNAFDMRDQSLVCLIDQRLTQKLFYGVDPLGQQIYVNGIQFTICGVLSDAGSGDVMAQSRGRSNRGKIIMPYTTAMRMSGTRLINSLEILVIDTALTNQVVDDCESILTAAFNYKENSFTIINMESLLQTMDTMVGMMTGMLVGIASIALLVGGIGIMNMMLVSVTERTVEIGLRKALGAEPGQIQLQFLIESFVLSVLGGIMGAAMGLSLSMLICKALDITFYFSAFAVALGVGFSAAVGIVFGWAPARKASNLNPIDALRSA